MSLVIACSGPNVDVCCLSARGLQPALPMPCFRVDATEPDVSNLGSCSGALILRLEFNPHDRHGMFYMWRVIVQEEGVARLVAGPSKD